MIGGIAAFIEAHSHRPIAAFVPAGGPRLKSELARQGVLPEGPSGLSHDAYDLLRIGGWALVILGAVTVAAALIAYRRG